MAGGINKLSHRAVESWIKKGDARTPKKLFDGDGLFLAITPAGTPVWRLRYRLGEKDKTLEQYKKAAAAPPTGHNPPAAFARPFTRKKLM